MTGKYDIEVYNKNVHYALTVKRNLTIIQGFSATGKTELLRLIGQHEVYGASSGITVKSTVPCHVISGINWEMNIAAFQKSILFIDENVSFTRSKAFVDLVKQSDNYFVIVTRDDLHELPYSIEEIYGLRNTSDTQKYKTFHKVYNEMYRLYHLQSKDMAYERIITEDSNSGYEFFKRLFGDKCISAGGKSKVYDYALADDRSALFIVDGAAFGSEIGKLMRFIESNKRDCVIYAPESFEYLILCAGITDAEKDVLDATYNYADSCKYLSWERFFTWYLTERTNGTVYQYSKKKLNPAYLTEGAFKKLEGQLPEMLRRL